MLHTIKTKDGVKEVELTPIRAIRAKCLDCSCWQRDDVSSCPVTTCSLYPYRMGVNPDRQGTRPDMAKRMIEKAAEMKEMEMKAADKIDVVNGEIEETAVEFAAEPKKRGRPRKVAVNAAGDNAENADGPAAGGDSTESSEPQDSDATPKRRGRPKKKVAEPKVAEPKVAGKDVKKRGRPARGRN